MPTAISSRHLVLPLAKDQTMPALGLGMRMRQSATIPTIEHAVRVGFRLFDCAQLYNNEAQVGEGIAKVIASHEVVRQDLFLTNKLWNTHHRAERVAPACRASLKKMGLDYLDLYFIHTPFAFTPSDEIYPRDADGKIIYDTEVTLLQTWQAMEKLVDEGLCRFIGLSVIKLPELRLIYEKARIKPAVIQIEAHPYMPEWDMLEYCRVKKIVLQAFASIGVGGSVPNMLQDPVIVDIAKALKKTPAQVLLAWAVQRGTSALTSSTSPDHIREDFDISFLPASYMREIKEGIITRFRFNSIIETGIASFNFPGDA